jgi:hypothetical protein
MAARKSSAVTEKPVAAPTRTRKAAVPKVVEAAPVEQAAERPVLLLVADSSDGSRSTRKAPPSFKEPGDIWAVEVKRERVTTWRVQSFHATREQAEATVPKSIAKWGATEAQVIPAKVVLVEGTAAA